MITQRRHINLSRIKCFNDHLQWWDTCNIKLSTTGLLSATFLLNLFFSSNCSKAQYLRPEFTKDLLWIDGCYNPSSVFEGLNSTSTTHGEEFCDLKAIGLSFVASLKACAKKKDLEEGTRLHDHILKWGLLENNTYVGNTLVSMYSKCGALAKARDVLDQLPVRNVVSWSALITGYTQKGQGEEALNCYERMQSEGLSPNAVTYASILKACGIREASSKGKRIHDEIVSQGLLGKDIVLGNALVDMYVKCGMLAKAQQVFDELPERNVVSWSTLIAGYVQKGQGEEALNCYGQMQSEGLSPNAITYACILKACGIIGAADRGKQIHDEIVSQGLLQRDIVLGNALVDMYAMCGVLTKAQQVLDELPTRNIFSWSALIAGYVQKGQGEEALNCYERLQSEGLSPDAVTYACILKACGITQEVGRGKQIHDEIVSQGLLRRDIVLGNALVDMYVKCGEVTKAQQVLDELPVRDLVSWNALIAGYTQQGQVEEALDCFQQMQSEGLTPNVVSWSALIGGYAQQGQAEEALDCFQQMQCKGISPNAITLNCLLNACSRSGLEDEGQIYFENMNEKYGITPDAEHHTRMVDLFGRAGHFDKAMTVIKKMPSSDYSPIWSAILRACRKWGNVKLGRLAFELADK